MFHEWTQPITQAAMHSQGFKAVLDDALGFSVAGCGPEVIFDAVRQFVERRFHIINVRLKRRGNAARFGDDQGALGDAEQDDPVPFKIAVHPVMEVEQYFAALRQAHGDHGVHVRGLAGNHRPDDRRFVEEMIEFFQPAGMAGKISFTTGRPVTQKKKVNRARRQRLLKAGLIADVRREMAGFLDER
ncbi:MAG: hypothetical protein ABSF34_06450 [Verrucomicrobiota bacterium]